MGKHAVLIWVQETTLRTQEISTEVEKMGLSFK